MRHPILLFICLFSCCKLFTVKAQPTTCSPPDEACGPSCYSSSNQSCFYNSTVCTLEQQACPMYSDGAIQYSCYDPSSYVCFPDQRQLCPIGSLLCGVNCYDPTERTCWNTEYSLVCDNTKLGCGTATCYFPDEYVCYTANDTANGVVLCQVPASIQLCNGGCIAPSATCYSNENAITLLR